MPTTAKPQPLQTPKSLEPPDPGFGQSMMYAYTPQERAYMLQQTSHPYLRTLGGLGIGALFGAGASIAQGGSGLKGALLGGALGSATGYGLNKVASKQGQYALNQRFKAIDSNNQSFGDTVKNEMDTANLYQQSVDPFDQIPDLLPEDFKGVSGLTDARKRLEAYKTRVDETRGQAVNTLGWEAQQRLREQGMQTPGQAVSGTGGVTPDVAKPNGALSAGVSQTDINFAAIPNYQKFVDPKALSDLTTSTAQQLQVPARIGQAQAMTEQAKANAGKLNYETQNVLPQQVQESRARAALSMSNIQRNVAQINELNRRGTQQNAAMEKLNQIEADLQPMIESGEMPDNALGILLSVGSKNFASVYNGLLKTPGYYKRSGKEGKLYSFKRTTIPTQDSNATSWNLDGMD